MLFLEVKEHFLKTQKGGFMFEEMQNKEVDFNYHMELRISEWLNRKRKTLYYLRLVCPECGMIRNHEVLFVDKTQNEVKCGCLSCQEVFFVKGVIADLKI